MYSDDYSSVASADIDNALSGEEDDDIHDDDSRVPLPTTTTTTTTGSGRHVAFAEEEVIDGGDVRSLDASYAVRRSCFDRGSAERRTLPAFTTNDLVSGLFFRRDMKASTRTADAQRQPQRPRSKSAGRTSTPKKDGSGVTPVASSTPKPTKQSSAPDNSSAVDQEAVRGERLSNYEKGSVLVGRRTCPPVPLTRHGLDGASRLLCGRRSVDSAMSGGTSVSSKQLGQDGLGELGVSPYGYGPPRRRCITPVNESTLTDTASLGYHLRRPQLPSSAIPDSDAPPSYYSSPSGRRSLPRTGAVVPQGCPPSFYHPDSSHGLSPCPAGGPYWPPYSRPQSSTVSTVSGSADNIRKK